MTSPFEQSLSANQSMRQEQTMSARQLQSLEILHAPIQELQLRLAEELAANPVLEAELPDNEISVGDPLSAVEAPEAGPTGDDDAELDRLFDAADEWHDQLPLPAENEAGNDPRDYLFHSLSHEVSLQEQLLAELNLAGADSRTGEIAAMVIGSIDDSGYLRTHPADIAMATGASEAEVERAVKLVQSFDPPGVGARDLAECMRLQLERRGEKDRRLFALLDGHLDDIARNRLPQVAKALRISMTELDRLLEKLRRLNPFPGAALSPAASGYVVPEAVIVRDENGTFNVRDDRRLIRLHIPDRYFKMLEDSELDAEDRAYIREKIASARELIRALDQRESTIRALARVIAAGQHDFLEHGVEHLRPMTMRQAAEQIGVHETTISRAISGKYLETPRGVFEFKYFFSGGFQTEGGAAVSSRSVQDKIRQLVAAENADKPLSDEKLSRMLKEDGLDVARRTVAKYREEIGIPATHLRRRHR
jgi:RNA polymerase sigma-54 factor